MRGTKGKALMRSAPGLGCAALILAAACSAPTRPPAVTPKPADASPIRTIAQAPVVARVGAAAVWSGREMLVWGGSGEPAEPRKGHARFLADGAAYDPATDRWRVLPPSPLTARTGSAAAWTGTTLFVWGGYTATGTIRDGAEHIPATGQWKPVPASPLRTGAASSALWTGREVIVFAGHHLAAFDPSARTWRALPQPPPPGDQPMTPVWTGREVVVLVETYGPDGIVGAALDPAGGGWKRLPKSRVAGGWSGAVWTGSQVLALSSSTRRITGGSTDPLPRPLDPSGAYDPSTREWTRVPLAPSHQNVYTTTPIAAGRSVVLWGGTLNALVYRPDTRRWTSLTLPKTPWRERPSLVWTGTEIIAWGGDSCGPAADCAALNPVPTGIALRPPP